MGFAVSGAASVAAALASGALLRATTCPLGSTTRKVSTPPLVPRLMPVSSSSEPSSLLPNVIWGISDRRARGLHVRHEVPAERCADCEQHEILNLHVSLPPCS